MAIYTFVNGQRKRAFTYNPRVIVGGAVKKVIEGYTFINGQRHKLFGKWSFDHTEVYLEHSLESLPFGTYRIACRGAGGGGGRTGETHGASGGAGGAGAKGELVAEDITFTELTTVNIHVGTGGVAGAGGAGGEGVANGADGGAGGGAGVPSVVIWETNQELHNVHANGGGGGGGGGGGSITWGDRQQYGSGGGGGGEYLRFDTVVDIDTYRVAVILGKKGGASGDYYSRGGHAGIEGNTTDFPDIISGAGGIGGDYGGDRVQGGAGASGGGASGGGGGSNTYNANGSAGGVGGGGAGGSADAGGGAKGNGGIYGGGADGYNHHTIPTDTTAENSLYGVDANYGIGGTTNQNGSQGFVVIRRIA